MSFHSAVMLAVTRDIDHALMTDVFFRTALAVCFFLGLWVITRADRHF